MQIKENTKAPRHWPFGWESTSDRWIPHTKGQWRGKCFHLMTSSWNTIFIATLVMENGRCCTLPIPTGGILIRAIEINWWSFCYKIGFFHSVSPKKCRIWLSMISRNYPDISKTLVNSGTHQPHSMSQKLYTYLTWFKNIGAQKKWPPICTRPFQTHVVENVWISTNFTVKLFPRIQLSTSNVELAGSHYLNQW